MVSSREDFTTLLRLKWFDALHVEFGNNQFATVGGTGQIGTELRWLLHVKNRGMFQDNRDFKGVKINLTLKSRDTTSPTKSTASSVRWQQSLVGETPKLQCRGHTRTWEKTGSTSTTNIVRTTKKYWTVKNALDSRILNSTFK